MRPHEIQHLEAHLLQQHPHGACGQAIRTLVAHTRELQVFVQALTDHHATPGPSPEKIAEHYQLVSRAKALRAQFEPVQPPTNAA
jgi:hypothetical protein